MLNGKPCILCVDDEPLNLKLLESLLLPRGYAVIQASDGTEALTKIKEHIIDLVLLDVMMPNLNGFDVMQSLFLKSLSEQIRDTDDAFAYTVHALARAAEVNDEDTGNHILRVGEYCGLIAEHLGMPAKFIDIIKLQALMHDVGKMHIPSEILKKPGKLTQEEFELVKQHPLYGAKIIGNHVRLTMAKEIALFHHERWDGGGYPYGLKQEQIPFTGRILNIADIYDALRNKRVYKPAFDHETAYRIITKGDGRTMPHHFDPRLLQVFRETATRFGEIYDRMQG